MSYLTVENAKTLIQNGHATKCPPAKNGFITNALHESNASKDMSNGSISNGNGAFHHSKKEQPLTILSRLNVMSSNLFYFFWKHFRRLFSRHSSKSKPHLNGSACKMQESHSDPDEWKSRESFEAPSVYVVATTMLGFTMVMLLNALSRFVYAPKVAVENKNRKGYAPLYNKFDLFYSQYVYRRVKDCWNRPICSVPGVEVELKDRVSHDSNWTFQFSGTTSKCINLGSYNYLGFAENSGPSIEAVKETIKTYGVSLCSSPSEYGLSPLHFELEKLTARFLGVDDAIIFGMGFGTNVLNLPCILSEGCLVFSDEKNHASLILSLRLSKASITVFKHNNMKDLERKLRTAIIKGQPKTGKPWKKILVIVEGVYSMEGSIVHLPQLLKLKEKYKVYLYVDEAHSVGALGPGGRGVTEYFGIDPKKIDILMGTFTKSFNAAGGYLAGSQEVIDYIRRNSHGTHYAPSMSPPIMRQISTTMRIIMGEDGTDEGQRRIGQLRKNIRYFRQKLHQIGVIIFGNDNSPVVPLMVYLFSKLHVVLKEFKERNVAVVGVGFPAAPLYMGRLRFCISAGHTKEQLDTAIGIIAEFADQFGLKYSKKPRFEGEIKYEDVKV